MDISNLKSMLQGKITREQCIQVAVITDLDSKHLQEIRNSEDSLNLLIDKLRQSGQIHGTENDAFEFVLDKLFVIEVPTCICGSVSSFREIKSENDDSRIVILRCENYSKTCIADWVHSTLILENTSASQPGAKTFRLKWNGSTFLCKSPSFFKPSDLSSEDVTEVSQLRRGDHIIFRRLKGGYYHHAIFVEVDGDKLRVIQWTTHRRDGKSCAKISDDSVEFPQGGVIRRNYNNSDHTDVVIAKAFDMKNNSTEKYDLFTNNCESLATYCKVGLSFSFQGEALQHLLSPALIYLGRFLGSSLTEGK